MVSYSDEIKAQFMRKLCSNVAMSQIVQEMPNVPARTLYGWKRRALARGSLVPNKSPGRPKKITEREARLIHRSVKSDPGQKIAELIASTGVPVCHDTMVKELKRWNIRSTVAAKRPMLTDNQIAMRRRFAQIHAGQDLDYWKRWVFSDECSVELDCAEGTVRWLITPQERYKQQFIQGKRQGGGGKLMIWSMISFNGMAPLVFIEGTQDARGYKELLQREVLPVMLGRLDDFPEGSYYMDDGASCHDAHSVIQFCYEKGIDRPFWPSNSPDMNPIEWIWGWLKHALSNLKSKPRNIAELKLALIQLANALTLQSIQKLIAGMPKRIEELSRVNGCCTNY